MKIDLHVHTAHGSPDATIDPDELVEIARARGLDGVCITEHGRRRTPLAATLSGCHRFLVLGGMEVRCDLGDILVFGVEAVPEGLSTARQVRAYVAGRGGAIIWAHPFRADLSPRPWVGPLDPELSVEKALRRPILRLVDALEVVNGQSGWADVEFTREVCRRAGLAETGGSDAHDPLEIGRCCTVFADGVRDEVELVAALRSGRCRAEDRRPGAAACQGRDG